MTIDLEPCPFCGSGAVFARDNDEDGAFVAVQCTGCGCGSGKHYPIMDSADANAANEWNTRAPSAAARERDGLREALREIAFDDEPMDVEGIVMFARQVLQAGEKG